MEKGMMRENLTWPKRMVFALTIFSLFFGAGNLIFPPYLAFQAGENITKAFPGFAITAILFPILGLVSVAKVEGIDNLSSRVGKTFSFLFTLVVYLAIGPCLAIPRTASTSYEMFASAISADNKVIEAVYSIAFFSLAALFSLRPEKLAEKLGKVLSPALLTLLLILFLSSMAIYPEDAVMDIHQNYSATPFFQGFLDGYQTMDAAAALVFGMVVVLNAKTLSEGRNVDLVREEAKSGFIAAILLFAVYFALVVIGRVSGYYWNDVSNGTMLLSNITGGVFGQFGKVFIAAIFMIACFNTCVGLLSSCATYFEKLFPKPGYIKWLMIFAVSSALIANAGLDAIIKASVPALSLLYPIVLILIVLSLFPYKSGMNIIYKLSTLFAFIPSLLHVLSSYLESFAKLDSYLPFSESGLGWVVPALIGLSIGLLIFSIRSIEKK